MTNQEEYVPRPHTVRSHGVLTYGRLRDGDVRIKTYSMMPEGEEDFTRDELRDMTEVLRSAVENFSLKPAQIWPDFPTGFSIMSDGVLNVAVWGGKYPSLLNQAVYSFERPNIRGAHFTRLDLEGTFCCWELGLAAHEGAAWRRYLLSSQSHQDREAYLADRFEGIVT